MQRGGPRPSFLPLCTNVVEGEFSEVELPIYGVLKKFVLLRQGPVPHPYTGSGQYRSRISYYAGGVSGE